MESRQGCSEKGIPEKMFRNANVWIVRNFCFAFSINESRSWWPLRSHVSTLALGEGHHFQHVKKSTLLKTQHLHLIISRGVKYLELTLLLPGGMVSLATPPSEPSLSSRNRTSLRHPTNVISLPVSGYIGTNDLT